VIECYSREWDEFHAMGKDRAVGDSTVCIRADGQFAGEWGEDCGILLRLKCRKEVAKQDFIGKTAPSAAH